ncbi:hypothetical protein G7Y79_00046g082680 [Physcia stellaris]|nr:hypothetical protein G7Y79_00046g082680 [Physcia stellaris]
MQSKVKLLLISLLSTTALAFPWLRPDADMTDIRRGMEAIRNDPETSQLIRDLWHQQQNEKRAFFENRGTEAGDEDFLPTNITGLKKFPEAAYPYQDPKASDQRGPCPGLNTLANHGYINRNGITTVAQSVAASAKVFNMGADLAAFLAGGSVVFAGDIPSMTYSIGGADARTNSLGINAAKTVGAGQYNVRAITQHFANQYKKSRDTNPYFYFFPPQAALTSGAEYFHAGFFSNGTIGAGGVANEASIASFNGAKFDSKGGITYMPEQIPPQGWYRRGYPMFLTEGIQGIITLYAGAAAILGQPLLFGANTGTPGSFTGSFSLAQWAGSGNYGGTTVKGVACALEGAVYGNFVSEFSNILNAGTAAVSALEVPFGQYGCPVPTGAPPQEATAKTYPGYPKPQPCKLNKMQNGYSQCAPDTNTYASFNTPKVPFCLNNPVTAAPASNPLPVPLVT